MSQQPSVSSVVPPLIITHNTPESIRQNSSYLSQRDERSIITEELGFLDASPGSPWSDRYSPRTYVFSDPIGIWLNSMMTRMRNLVKIASYANMNITSQAGGAYLMAFEHMVDLASDDSSTVTTSEVLWELYRWQKMAIEKNPHRVPLTLQTEWWLPMNASAMIAIMDQSVPQEEIYVPEEVAHSSSNQEDEMSDDYDSDTDIEARVSPELSHPLSSGDPLEDQEMEARSLFNSAFTSERSVFSDLMCDNM